MAEHCRGCGYTLPDHRPGCRTDAICRAIWDEVFVALDGEIEIPGNLAGKAAAAAESAVRSAITA